MRLSPEARAQLSQQKKQCVFCKIVEGEVPAQEVFGDRETKAVLDIYPAVKGHTLFFPRLHYPILMYFEPSEIRPFFALMPQIVRSIKEAMVSTGVSIFMALGGAAGQQSSHFMAHIIPRESGDGLLNFHFKNKASLSAGMQRKLLEVFAEAMKQYFSEKAEEVPAKGVRNSWLERRVAGSLVLFEDERVLVCARGEGMVEGQIEVYSKIEEKMLEKLDEDEAAYLFSITNQAAAVLFSVLRPQGTNIIIKSGSCDDNPDGQMCVYIIPRYYEDHLQGLMWTMQQPKYDLSGVAKKIKDKMWRVKYSSYGVDGIGNNRMEPTDRDLVDNEYKKTPERKADSSRDQILDAIKRYWN